MCFLKATGDEHAHCCSCSFHLAQQDSKHSLRLHNNSMIKWRNEKPTGGAKNKTNNVDDNTPDDDVESWSCAYTVKAVVTEAEPAAVLPAISVRSTFRSALPHRAA